MHSNFSQEEDELDKVVTELEKLNALADSPAPVMRRKKLTDCEVMDKLSKCFSYSRFIHVCFLASEDAFTPR